MEPRWGKLLGRYEIVSELGRGAMGTVYKARDPKIDRFVAIKTISLRRAGLQEQREFRERFFVEAQAAGRLIHPNIVTVFDVGENPETSDPYIVMEYVQGQSLRDLLAGEDRKLPLDTALRMTQELAEALDYAHAQGVVHRDIKPANILVTRAGQAKIGDFGIAQLDLAHITLPGRVVGTPAFMSPEQLEGRQVDGRSDLFSLGAVLYSLVTGFSPFQGTSATTVCFKVANVSPLQASTLVPDLPPELDSVIARALAKDPAGRYQRGMEFALDLRELRQGVRQTPRGQKGMFWFAQPEGDSSRLDPGEGNESPLASAAHIDSSRASRQTPGRAAKIYRRAASPLRLVIGAVISVFLCAMILSVFARREHHTSDPQPTSAVATTNGVSVSPPTSAVETTNGTSLSTLPETQGRQAAPRVSRSRPAIPDSALQICIDHHFSDATLSVWIDSKLAYSGSLRDGHKKRFILLGGGAKETVTIPLAAGQHGLRVRVQSETEQYEQSRTVSGEFPKGVAKVLSVKFEKHTQEMRITWR